MSSEKIILGKIKISAIYGEQADGSHSYDYIIMNNETKDYLGMFNEEQGRALQLFLRADTTK